MKNVFFIILSVIILSCQNNGKPKEATKTETMEEKYDNACKKAALSPQTVDTVFMGLTFGMSEKQAMSHCANYSRMVNWKIILAA